MTSTLRWSGWIDGSDEVLHEGSALGVRGDVPQGVYVGLLEDPGDLLEPLGQLVPLGGCGLDGGPLCSQCVELN